MESTPSPRRPVAPLGLPAGSVRALLALSVVFVTAWLMVTRDERTEVPMAVSEALFVVLAYYFATRARDVRLTQEELERLQARRGDVWELNPLYLPRGTIRTVIILAFAGVAVYLGYRGGLRGLLSATTLLLVLAFFAGRVAKHVVRWLKPARDRHTASTFEHIKAALGLAVVAAFVVLYVSGWHRSAPPRVHKLFLGFIIFYFGSR